MPQFENAPKAMNDLMEAVYAKCMAGGGSGELCAREAIAAAREAGWRKGDDGKWHRKETMKETYEIPNVEIFSTGQHHGFGFDETVLRQMVADTNSLVGREPFVRVGHEGDGGGEDTHPRVGLLRNIRFHAGKVLADFVNVPARIMEAIRAGAIPKRSVELVRDFRDKSGEVLPWVIDCVALLGAAHPEVKDLQDIETVYAKEQRESGRLVAFSEGWPEKEIKTMAEPIEKPAPVVEAPKAEAAAAPAPAQKPAADALAVIRAERDTLKAELDALKAEKTKDADRIAALEKRINEMAIDRELDALGTRITPAEKEELKVELAELQKSTVKVKFGESEMTLYEKRLADLRKREPVKFAEKLPNGEPGGADEWTPERLKRAGLTKEKVEKLRAGGLL